jgi:signal peptidase I
VACTPDLACGDVAEQQVPEGRVFVLGDHRDHSAGSRVYGPIAESAVLGRAAYVTLSFGPAGLRRDRVGSAIR